MAAVCFFWRMTPGEYKQLTLREIQALTRFEDEYAKQQKQAAR